MTDDLRARITAALEESRTLIPSSQADVVMAVLQPEIERVRFNARHYTSHGRCRYCGARGLPESMRQPHRMYCRLYVGPLEHRKRGSHDTLGGYVNDCTCGKSWRDENGGCPDAEYNWRGPVPDEAGGQP